MFTTGSKLHVGLGVVAGVAVVALGVTNGGDVGRTAVIGLASAFVAMALLTAINFFTRDATVDPADPTALTESAAAQPRAGASIWPLVSAVGAGTTVVGLVTEPAFFKAGILVLLAALVEWMVQGWSERASADRTYNASLRKRLLHPLEFPLLGAALLAVIIYSFSRIMLFVSKSGGPAVFGVLATLVLVGGVLFAYSPGLKKSVAIATSTIAIVGLVSTGAVMAIDGERPIEKHPTVSEDPSVCSSNEHTEIDDKSSQSVAAKSNVTATITLRNGQLTASQVGIDVPLTTITISRSNPSNIIFVNEDPEPVRLTANMGTYDETVNGKAVATKHVACTTLVRKDGRQLITLIYPKSSRALPADQPYTFSVPGNTSSVITVEVP